MSGLVNDLKQEHETLVGVLNNIKQVGITSPEARAQLAAAKDGLLTHLQKEDAELYPKLREKATSDPNLANILNTFAKDMEGISSAALGFFEKYEDGGSPVEFAKDFGALMGALGNRIRKEESILYAEFDKLG